MLLGLVFGVIAVGILALTTWPVTLLALPPAMLSAWLLNRWWRWRSEYRIFYKGRRKIQPWVEPQIPTIPYITPEQQEEMRQAILANRTQEHRQEPPWGRS